MAVIYVLLVASGSVEFKNIPHVFLFQFLKVHLHRHLLPEGGQSASFHQYEKRCVQRNFLSLMRQVLVPDRLHIHVQIQKPVKQGFFGIFEVFIDTIVICTLTALVILCDEFRLVTWEAAGAELTILGFTSTYGSWVSIFYRGCNVLLCIFNDYRMGTLWNQMY